MNQPANDTELYVQAGFLVDVYEEWREAFPDDDWGVMLSAYWDAAKVSVSASRSDNALALIAMIQPELDAAFTEGQDWVGDYRSEIRRARLALPGVIAYWTDRSAYFGATPVFQAALEALPSWLHPQPGDDEPHPEDDPEYPEHLRLKAKFEGS